MIAVAINWRYSEITSKHHPFCCPHLGVAGPEASHQKLGAQIFDRLVQTSVKGHDLTAGSPTDG